MPEHVVFPIRHHGPGSARSLRAALAELDPDVVLIEGPPDGQDALALVADTGLRPPVALLVYAAADVTQAAFFPFAAFSPEWQALQHASERGVEARLVDLPQSAQLGVARPPRPRRRRRPGDPLALLAEAAGMDDGERWWDRIVEQRRDALGLFEAVREAMRAVREAVGEDDDPREAQREAAMRQGIRSARRDGFERIAVVCGAWHAPALERLGPANADAALLRGLPRTRVRATWVPWSYGRLSFHSGYGAGVTSPGWYDHLFAHDDRIAERWLARVAQLLRGEGLDASPAQLVDAVRLAEALAALRSQPQPGLAELDEAVRAALLFGDDTAMTLVHERLIVGEQLGAVPPGAPRVPLQADLEALQRRLRLRPDPSARTLDLDLRKPNDLQRSHLLHRLALIGIPWGELQPTFGKSGTFHELWQLRWDPGFAIALIEASAWGTTVEAAASARCATLAAEAATLPALTELVERALLASLPDAVRELVRRLEREAALADDLAHLMDALPPLVSVLRYGDVRGTDAPAVAHVVDGLVARICIGLGPAASSLDDGAAQALRRRIDTVHAAVALLGEGDQAQWQEALDRLAVREGLHGLVAGRAARLLLDAGHTSREETARRMALALSRGAEPAAGAAWIEGFVAGSAALLVHDEVLFSVLDAWLDGLSGEAFEAVLALLRRAFSEYAQAERRAIGERARRGTAAAAAAREGELDEERVQALLPVLAELLGVER